MRSLVKNARILVRELTEPNEWNADIPLQKLSPNPQYAATLCRVPIHLKAGSL